jgi:endonuclease/exonuclease/phosphatase (EEP) superfamily protein YafD
MKLDLSACRSSLRGRHGVLLLAVATLTSCRAHGIAYVDAFCGARTLGSELTLLVWNVQKGLDDGLRDDLRALTTIEQPDLLLVQEGRDDLHPGEGLGGAFGKSWRYPWSRRAAEGVASYSRVLPERVDLLPSPRREFAITAPKTSLVTYYPIEDGRRLLVANVHLMAFERWGTGRLRAQLAELHERIAAHDGPVLLAGDFNTWCGRRLELVRAMARDLCLEEVEAFPEGRRTGDRGWLPVNWICGVDPALALDRVFVRGLVPLCAEVLGEWRSSDHVPLLAVLRVEAAPVGDAQRGG